MKPGMSLKPRKVFLHKLLTHKTFNSLVSCLKVHNTHTEHFAIALWLPHRCIIRVHNTHKRRQKACVKGFLDQPTQKPQYPLPDSVWTGNETTYTEPILTLPLVMPNSEVETMVSTCLLPILALSVACLQWGTNPYTTWRDPLNRDTISWGACKTEKELCNVITFLTGYCNAWKVSSVYLFFRQVTQV